MYCKNCGEIIDDDAVFCPICGTDQTLENEIDQKSKKRKITTLVKTVGTVVAIPILEQVVQQIIEGVSNNSQQIIKDVTGSVGKSLQKKTKQVTHKALVGLKVQKPSIPERIKKSVKNKNAKR